MSEHTPHIEPQFTATGSLAPAYFERLYTANGDPWDFETSPYEAAKYAATLAALPCAKYARALELGCSIGVLTRQLATRCDHLLAVDISHTALARARQRCGDLSNISFEELDLTIQFPSGVFDLILISEIGYYLSLPDLAVFRAKIAEVLSSGGHLVMVHYTGETNYPLTADQVHDAFQDWPASPLAPIQSTTTSEYRLDVLQFIE
jgi:predicted TPR repeat methyltransferase